MEERVIRPGYLVHLSVRGRGGVHHEREEIESRTEGAAEIREWKARTTTDDKLEHEKAGILQRQLRYMVQRVCVYTPLDRVLVCPREKLPELLGAIREARRLVGLFNAESKYRKVSVVVVKARIASDDADAAQALLGECTEIAQALEAALASQDVKAMRTAAKSGAELLKLLEEKSPEQVEMKGAIEAVRALARKIVKAGDDAATKVEAAEWQKAFAPVAQSRFRFEKRIRQDGDKEVAA